MTSTYRFPIVTIAGSPRERGRQYAAAARSRIERSFANYLPRLRERGLDSGGAMDAHVAGFHDAIGDNFPELIDEMAGLADGFGCHVSDVIALNARTELLFGELSEGCTGAVLLPERTDNRTIIGQNWDWWPGAGNSAIVLRVLRDKAPSILTFVEAGMLARSGMNDAGLGLCGNFLECDGPKGDEGLPIPVVRRAILSSMTIADAIEVVYRFPRTFATNHLIAQADGVAVDLEAAPQEVFPVFADAGLLIHSNHFRSLAAKAKLTDTGIKRFPDTLLRDTQVRKALDHTSGPLAVEDLMTAFKDHSCYPASVCRHAARRQDEPTIETVASLVMDLQEQVMWIAAGPPCTEPYAPVFLKANQDDGVPREAET
jgi:isopenicillin-N N-acyltransferase-like protein